MSTTCKSTLATGEPCNAPAINECFSCRHHDPSHPHKTAQPRRRESEPLELPPLVDKCGILSAVVEVVRAVSERRMKRSEGGTLLFGLQLVGSLMYQIDEEGAYPGDFAEPIDPGSFVYSNQHMATRLDTITATTRATVASAKDRSPVPELERMAALHQPRGWAAALRKRSESAPAVIAEIKKASPSKGLIREDFDVKWLAARYQYGGAAALSVLTDEAYFQGSLRNLEIASAAVDLPCLRKDFTVDEYQILEARAHHADAILLIAAALVREELKRFSRVAHELELDVLVEVHTPDELDEVLDTLGNGGADAIGVNNRNLKTFEVRMETSLELVDRIPSSVVRVAESGISTSDDIGRLRAAGFDAFLIGESLMRRPDPGEALLQLLAGTRVNL